MLKNAAAIHRA